jgi:hypothetical protein
VTVCLRPEPILPSNPLDLLFPFLSKIGTRVCLSGGGMHVRWIGRDKKRARCEKNKRKKNPKV